MRLCHVLPLGVVFLSMAPYRVEAQVDFTPPADVKLATRFSVDPAAVWAEMPVTDRSNDFDQQRRTLEQVVAQVAGPLDQAQAHLALANWDLAIPTATPATKWLLNMASEKDLKVLSEAAAGATEHLRQARLLLKKVPTTTSAPADPAFSAADVGRRKGLESAADTLEPFRTALAAAVLTGDENSDKETRNQAARSLSAVREVADEEVAACALMWQAFLWNLAGRDGRSTVSLPNATVKPAQPGYDFISRLLRCQILADNGHYPAAMAMAGRVRTSCAEWFPNEAREQIEARERLAALEQCRIGGEWMSLLRKDNFPSNADRLEALLVQVQEAVFPMDKAPFTIYTLDRAVPLFISPPKLQPGSRPAPSTATSPG